MSGVSLTFCLALFPPSTSEVSAPDSGLCGRILAHPDHDLERPSVSQYSCLSTHLIDHPGGAGCASCTVVDGAHGFWSIRGGRVPACAWQQLTAYRPHRGKVPGMLLVVPWALRTGHSGREKLLSGPSASFCLSCASFLLLPGPKETTPGRELPHEAAFSPDLLVELSV